MWITNSYSWEQVGPIERECAHAFHLVVWGFPGLVMIKAWPSLLKRLVFPISLYLFFPVDGGFQWNAYFHSLIMASAEDTAPLLACGPKSNPAYPFVWLSDMIYHHGGLPDIQSSRKFVGSALRRLAPENQTTHRKRARALALSGSLPWVSTVHSLGNSSGTHTGDRLLHGGPLCTTS